jgi:ribosomal protein L11 methyltransferase
MEWLEISIDAPDRDTEALCALLDSLGAGGLVIEDEKDIEGFLRESGRFWDAVDEDFLASRKGVSRVKFYVSADEEGEKSLEAMRPPLEQAGYRLQRRTLRDEDWENNWKQYYRPMEVGRRLLILPEWEPVPVDGLRVPLRLDPGLIFGTGAHPSTRMCLEAAEDLAPRAEKVLDLGCGSGILAIAALLLGAKSALGCDIDEASPRIAAENAALNGVEDRLTVLAGDATADKALRQVIGGREYDIVFLNIVADVILALLPDIPRWLRESGTLIVSGVIDGREGEIAAALKRQGFAFQQRRMGDWHSFICKSDRGGEAP